MRRRWTSLLWLFGFIISPFTALARIMREDLKSESHLCYKHVVQTVFMASRGAFACLILPRHSVCCSAICTSGLWCWPLTSGRAPVASGGEVTICFPHRYLTLRPLFRSRPRRSGTSTPRPSAASRCSFRASSRVRAMSCCCFPSGAHRLPWSIPGSARGAFVEVPGLSALPPAHRDENGGGPAREARRARGPAFSLGRRASTDRGRSRLDVPAFDVDREGNLWTWDAGERRIRIVTPRGREVFAIRPLFGASAMPLPQQLAVFDDGSFLLAGSGEVWKLQGSGVPVWRLAQKHGPHA